MKKSEGTVILYLKYECMDLLAAPGIAHAWAKVDKNLLYLKVSNSQKNYLLFS